jgi:Predicted ATPase (AAA+ superfamily)
MSKIRPFYDSDLIKVITGIRRCGKSVILDEIRKEIEIKSNNTIFLNLEHIYDIDKVQTARALVEYVRNNRKSDDLCYLFIDEIQNMPQWVDAVKTLRLEKCSIFISGSNSKMLSKEFINELSGRHVSFQIRPFVYVELKKYAEDLGVEIDVLNYLTWGGFPKRLEFKNTEDQIKYLEDIDTSIVIHDLIARYKIKKEVLFKRIVNFVLRNNSRIFSAKSVYDYILNEGYTCSINTVMNFINYLKEAFLIEEIKQYSTKVKRELSYFGKLYNMDVSSNSIRADRNRFDIEHNLENIVFNELIYKGYKVQLYNLNGYEIDFRCEKKSKIIFVQVAYSVVNETTYNREMKPFSLLDNSNEKILITTDKVDYSTSIVRHIELEKFLLQEDI